MSTEEETKKTQPKNTASAAAVAPAADAKGGEKRGRRDNRRDGGRGRGKPAQSQEESEFSEKLVHINRCAKTVKGGRNFSFAALMVVGDGKGKVGYGYGKAKEVPDSIRKGTDQAKRRMVPVQVKNNTIPHEVVGRADGGIVMLRPAVPGTGVIAGGGVRAVLEAVGINDVLSKSLGSNNPLALVQATLDGLKQLRTKENIMALRNAEADQE